MQWGPMPAGRQGVKRKDLDEVDFDDYTSFNFRVSTELKKEFQLLCKQNHISAAAAIKRYMTRAIEVRNLG